MLNKYFRFIRRTVARSPAALIAGVALVAGCASAGGADGRNRSSSLESTVIAAQIPTLARDDSVLKYVASAPDDGQAGRVVISKPATTVHVRVGRIYEAASGLSCRSYHLSVSEDAPTASSNIACRGSNGRWFQSRLLVNPDSLDESESSALRAGRPQ